MPTCDFRLQKLGGGNYIDIGIGNEEDYNVYANVNFEQGTYSNIEKVFLGGRRETFELADKAKEQGSIPLWSDLIDYAERFARKYNALEFLGFDFCISTKGVKCMEINSHSGVQFVQVYYPLMTDPIARSFFNEKLRCIDSLSETERITRNEIVR